MTIKQALDRGCIHNVYTLNELNCKKSREPMCTIWFGMMAKLWDMGVRGRS